MTRRQHLNVKLLIVTMVMMSSLLYSACSAAINMSLPPEEATSTAISKTSDTQVVDVPNGNETATVTGTPTTIPGTTPGVTRSPMPTQPATGSSTNRRAWSAIRNWVNWLDGPNIQQLAANGSDLIVMDYSADGSAALAFTPSQINQLRQNNSQRRVVAYLSIGQAESYRGYWQSSWKPGSPSWLIKADPDWTDNYWVRYWDTAWQQVIYQYLDAIIKAGFDGIYLDRIDAYEESFASGREQDMVKFVMDLASYARSHSPLGQDFGIIAQNAEELAGKHMDYVQAVTGVAREEVYVRATNSSTSASERSNVESYLDIFRQNSRGKLVLTIDYASRQDLMCDAYQHAHARGYVPYVGNVALNGLTAQPNCS